MTNPPATTKTTLEDSIAAYANEFERRRQITYENNRKSNPAHIQHDPAPEYEPK